MKLLKKCNVCFLVLPDYLDFERVRKTKKSCRHHLYFLYLLFLLPVSSMKVFHLLELFMYVY